MSLPTPTAIDNDNASKYATHMHRLRYIPRWRAKLPNILIDYEIRPANNNDFYVPPLLAHKALHVTLKFSRRGCESMTCYPFMETGPVDFSTRTNYTQTSETSVMYAQPACYHLDRAAATREGAENEIQSPELRYTNDRKCVLVDTMSKMYLNSPYLRTDEHLIQGVDDVPGFNVTPSADPLFPERFVGTFNEAYCRRFGRDLLANGGCGLRWWESLIGFVLGDTIYVTLKLLTNNVFSELRQFDYKRPSPILPQKPSLNSEAFLQAWRNVRDAAVDADFERSFVNYKDYESLGIDAQSKLIYTAERGFSTQRINTPRNLKFRQATSEFSSPFSTNEDFIYNNNARFETSNNVSDYDLETIVSQFLEDNALIMGIAASYGFDLLMDAIKAILKRINTTLIPTLKQMLLSTSRRVTVRMLGETYKAAITHSFNRIAIKTITVVSKALTRMAIQAASVIGIILIILTIADLILALWDPFGYSNMFPREFPDDLSLAFLTAYFESLSGGSRDLIEFIPEYFDDIIDDTDILDLTTLSDLFEYIVSLDVNSNGQRLELDTGEAIEDFDEATLVGSALASSALYTYLDFVQYTERHNKALLLSAQNNNTYNTNYRLILAALFSLSALTLMFVQRDSNTFALFVIMLLIVFYLIVVESLSYYFQLRNFTTYQFRDNWYDNLYT